MLYKFRSHDINPESIIGNVFVYENHSYKITDLTKSWGESPILLGYVDAENELGERFSFLIRCRKSFVDGKWDVTINEKP